jgi:hypothetical protein
LLIKRRLEEILNISADVDYAAELKETEWKGKNGKSLLTLRMKGNQKMEVCLPCR